MSVARIRPARSEDIAGLAAVEHSAQQLFRTVGLAMIADYPKLPPAVLLRALSAGLLWVAADDSDAPAGFLAAEPMGPDLFVTELSVAGPWQRRGIGRRLLAAAIERGRRDFAGLALTTYRDVPWNAPFYASMGFAELDPPPAELAAQLAREAAWHDIARRCAMRRPNDAAGTAASGRGG